MNEKNFFLLSEEIKSFIKPMGSCYASDKITVDGIKVKYMYRESPMEQGTIICQKELQMCKQPDR